MNERDVSEGTKVPGEGSYWDGYADGFDDGWGAEVDREMANRGNPDDDSYDRGYDHGFADGLDAGASPVDLGAAVGWVVVLSGWVGILLLLWNVCVWLRQN